MKALSVAVLLCGGLVPAKNNQASITPEPLTPIDPVAGIVAAFASHDVVGVSAGEGHGDVRGRDFFVMLIRDSRFNRLPVDVVTENGNARFQDIVDRYVRGEDVDLASLRHAWDDTTQPQVMSAAGDVPEIYRTVRELNSNRPRERQMRMILPDPPIDWDHVTTNADYRQWLEQRDSNGAAVVKREVLARKRRALLMYGAGHLQRRNQLTNYAMDHPYAQTVISLLEREGVRTFVIGTAGGSLQAGMDAWPKPSLALLRGTAIGMAPEPGGDRRVSIRADGQFVPIAREQWVSIPLQEQVDALLYVGPTSERRSEQMPIAICSEPGYVDKRLQRMALAGLPPPELARLKALCANR